jgi:thiol-disulfide isomerase/thioredoxin
VNPTTRRPLLAALAAALALAAPAVADAPKPPTHDPEARRLFDEVVAAYKALPAYADQGEFTTSATVDGAAQKRTLPFRLALARPNRLSLDAGPIRMTCDGMTLRTVVGPTKSYTEAPAPAAITLHTFVDSPMEAFLFGGPLGTPLPVLLGLLVADDPAATVLEITGGRLRAEPDRTLGDRPVRALLIDRDDAPDLRLLVDPGTKLLVRIEQVLGAEPPAAGLPEGTRVADLEVAWNAGSIATEAPRDETFALQAPQGLTQVNAPAAEGPAAKPEEPEHDLIGKPAPAFTLTVLDGEGKTKKVRKDDLAGKIVLIDFWATWCPPCRKELPEIQKLIEHFDRENPADVVVIALSLDRRPSDLAGVRSLVERSLSEQKLALSGGRVGQIALDPTGALGEAFDVSAIPTVVLLDRQGVIRLYHVGYDPEADIRATLTREITSLLDPAAPDAPKP